MKDPAPRVYHFYPATPVYHFYDNPHTMPTPCLQKLQELAPSLNIEFHGVTHVVPDRYKGSIKKILVHISLPLAR